MINTLLAILLGVMVLGLTATIVLLVVFLAKLLWDYISGNY